MYKHITFAAFIFIALAAQAQNRSAGDSLRAALSNARADTTRAKALSLIIDYYLRANVEHHLDTADLFLKQANQFNKKYRNAEFQNRINAHGAKSYFLQHPDSDPKAIFSPLIADCKKIGDKQNERIAWLYLAEAIELDEKQRPLLLNYYQHVMSLSREMGDEITEMSVFRKVADTHMKQLKFDLAESELFQIIKNKESAPDNLMFSYDLLTSLYTTKGDYDKALSYALKTEKGMEATKDSVYAVTFYGRLTYIYNVLGKIPLSLYWAKRTLNNVIQTNQLGLVYNISNYVVKCLIQEGKPREALTFILSQKAKYKPLNLNEERLMQKCIGDSYYALKEYAPAEKSYLEMVRLSSGSNNDNTEIKAASYNALGHFYVNTGNYKKAGKYLAEALNDYQAYGNINFIKDVHLSFFKVDSALGNYQSAIGHLQQYGKLKDSIFSVSKNKQIEELQIKYRTEEREKDFKLVQSKEKLAQVDLQHSENTRDWIIAGSGLLLIIAGLLYRQNRLKQKNNGIITHKNELLQSLVEEKEKNNGIITHKNELLQKLVEEKEWLLKEVHHRVKNNLHSVICLLESQAAYLENDALRAIEESQHRIYTMSLIHQKLYQSEDVKTIDMAAYIPELVQYLADSFDVSNRIYFNLVIEPISLNASQAIPLALIINEALTNSIKYAFPDNRRGEVIISFTDSNAQYKLQVADDGIGIAESKKKSSEGSLGLELMKGLAKEIMGEIMFESNNGVKVTIVFEHDALNDMDMLSADYLTTTESGGIYL